jgi:hypothetical protein
VAEHQNRSGRAPVGTKDKGGGKTSKKTASKNLKQKRAEKKAKRSAKGK